MAASERKPFAPSSKELLIGAVLLFLLNEKDKWLAARGRDIIGRKIR